MYLTKGGVFAYQRLNPWSDLIAVETRENEIQ